MRIIGCGYRDWSLKIFEKLNEHELSIITHPDLVSLQVIDSIKPDLVLFYGWSWIINDDILKKYLCLCLHPSPLPNYKGGTPIQHQIMSGETESAVTIFKMTTKLDAGPICFQKSFPLSGNISQIFSRIQKIGEDATLDIIHKLQNNDLHFSPQEQNEHIFKRRTPSESEITMDELKTNSAKEIHDKIRMLTDPYPNAFIKCADGQKLYITESYIDVCD